MEPDRERWYQQRIAELEEQVARLMEQVAKLSKNSSNSSKPPSSDIVKPPKPPKAEGKGRRRRRRIGGHSLWTWCFRAEMFTLFKIDPSRGSDVLIDVLGREFNGVLGCDYFSAYHKYMKDFGVAVQFCLAHLIRDVKFLLTLPDKVTRNYGRRLLDALRKLFRVIHQREEMTVPQFQRNLERARNNMLEVGRRAPPRSEARNLADRFRKHGDAYFRFMTSPGTEPTNNLAEQAIRFVVIDRRVTQGTRSQSGRRWCERIWTILATCTQQGRSVFAYLRDAIAAHLGGHPIPSLTPAKP